MSLLLNHLVEFGPYAFDSNTGRLTRGDKAVGLPPRAVPLLRYLILNRDHTVSRDELKASLWPDSHIEANRIDKQVSDLRRFLGTDDDGSAFIKTEYKRGWRFVADVREATLPVVYNDTVPDIIPATVRPLPPKAILLIAAALACAVTIFIVIRAHEKKAPLVGSQQLTDDGKIKLEPLLTDGKRIYFSEPFAGLSRIASVPVDGGPVSTVRLLDNSALLKDISPDGRNLLLQGIDSGLNSLWTLPTSGGEPKRLMAVSSEAGWSPDGLTLALAKTKSDQLEFQLVNNPAATHLFNVAGQIQSIRWSPDGRRLRLTVFDPAVESKSIWEVDAMSGRAEKLTALANGNVLTSNGTWTRDGRYFFYQAGDYQHQDLFAVSESALLPGFLHPKPFVLTRGPASWDAPVALPNSSRIAAIKQIYRSQLVGFDARAGVWQPMWNQSEAYELDYSRDHNWVAFTHLPDHTIWKCKPDGSAPVQLTDSAIEAHQAHWSPDGHQLAFMGKTKTGKWRVHAVSASGGPSVELLPKGGDQGVPTWSADGRYIAMGDLLDRADGPRMKIHVMDVATRDLVDLAHSNGLWSPRWSPDGKFIAAVTCDSHAIRIQSFTHPGAEAEWKEVTRMLFIDNATWSADSKYIYFDGDITAGPYRLFRVNVATSQLEQLADLKNFTAAHENWFGVSPDGQILAAQAVVSSEIWALNYQFP